MVVHLNCDIRPGTSTPGQQDHPAGGQDGKVTDSVQDHSLNLSHAPAHFKDFV